MRIILADHHAQPCRALTEILAEEPDFDLVGSVADAQELLALAEKQSPDLTLVDGDLPGDSIEDLIARLHALEPSPIVVVMSSRFEYSRQALKANADAFVSKGDQPDWLLEKLHQYARQFYIEDAKSNLG